LLMNMTNVRRENFPIQLAGDGIPCITGLQELENQKVEHNINFSSCMVGQATLQPYS
jgi:hypothetical protein